MKKLNIYLCKNSVVRFAECLKPLNENRHYESIKANQPVDDIDYDIYFIEGVPKQPKWLEFIEGYIEPDRLDNVTNVSNSVVIFLRVNIDGVNRIFVISEGFGYHVLDKEKIEGNFGLKTTLNSIDPKKVKSMDVKSLGVQTLQRREASNLATDFNEFGFAFDADILRVIMGNCIDPNLGTRIGGSDNLIITTDVDFHDLPEKCRQIYRKYILDDYRQDFGFIDYIQFEKDNSIVTNLENSLIRAINAHQDDFRIAVAYPDQIEYERCSIFNITGWGEQEELEDIALSDIYGFIQSHAPNNTVNSINDLKKKMRIIGLDLNGQAVSQSEPVNDYITFETETNGTKYVFCNGKWYKVDRNYLDNIDNEIRRLVRISPTILLDWSINPATNRHEEGFYNQTYNANPDFLCLDKNLYRFAGSPSSIEVADLFFLPSKKLFCVKKLNRSSTLSHLFSQASISASMFKDSGDYRRVFVSELERKWPGNGFQPENDYIKDMVFVFAIGTARPGDIFDILPIFSKINLLKHARILNRYGYQTEIVKINLV